MFVSTKKHNQLVLELAEANLDMQRYIKELEETIQDQFEILNKMYNCSDSELLEIMASSIKLEPIQYEEG